MGTHFTSRFTLGGETFDDVIVSWIGAAEGNTDAGAGAGYTMDVDVVLRILDTVGRGAATAQQAHDVLTTLVVRTCPLSGHCPDCEEAAGFYEQALADFARARNDLEVQTSRMTPASHPYVTTGNGTVHVWDCQRSGFGTITHPGGSLTEFAHGEYGRAGGWSYQPVSAARRVTGDDIIERTRSRGRQPRRCRWCQPALPNPYTSEAADVG